METWVWIVIMVSLALVVVMAWAMSTKRRTSSLQERFGTEYDRAGSVAGAR